MTKRKKKELAEQLIDLLSKYDCFIDVAIYDGNDCMVPAPVNAHAGEPEIMATRGMNTPYRLIKNRPYRDEYGNPDTLTVTFEGPLYDFMNGSDPLDVRSKMDALFESYELYCEQGYAWSFALYPV